MLKVLKYPDPFLFKVVEDVKIFDEELQKNAVEMLETMIESKGVGLAANQVGINKKIFVMKCDIKKEPYVLINPVIIEMSEEKMNDEEGCLSFPSLYFQLQRSKTVKLKWQDLIGEFHEEIFSDLEAVCVQHECEHLNGIVFINKLSPMKKTMVLNKFSKLNKKK
jgi:peptide deformylase